MAFQKPHRKANTPTMNSAIAVTAPTHCAAVVNTAAAKIAVTTNSAVPTMVALTMMIPCSVEPRAGVRSSSPVVTMPLCQQSQSKTPSVSPRR